MDIFNSVWSAALFFAIFVMGEEVVRRFWSKPISRKDFRLRIRMTVIIMTILLIFYAIRGEKFYCFQSLGVLITLFLWASIKYRDKSSVVRK